MAEWDILPVVVESSTRLVDGQHQSLQVGLVCAYSSMAR
jgi:hypothetical protein